MYHSKENIFYSLLLRGYIHQSKRYRHKHDTDPNQDKESTTPNTLHRTYLTDPTHPTPLAFFLFLDSSAFPSKQSFFCHQKKLASLGKPGQVFAWEVVTTRNFRSFVQMLNFHYSSRKVLFISYYSQITIHQCTIHNFWCQFEIPRNVHKIYYSHDTIHVLDSFHHKFSLRVIKFAKPVWFSCEFEESSFGTFHTD